LYADVQRRQIAGDGPATAVFVGQRFTGTRGAPRGKLATIARDHVKRTIVAGGVIAPDHLIDAPIRQQIIREPSRDVVLKSAMEQLHGSHIGTYEHIVVGPPPFARIPAAIVGEQFREMDGRILAASNVAVAMIRGHHDRDMIQHTVDASPTLENGM
jgi:hypothetical protein